MQRQSGGIHLVRGVGQRGEYSDVPAKQGSPGDQATQHKYHRREGRGEAVRRGPLTKSRSCASTEFSEATTASPHRIACPSAASCACCHNCRRCANACRPRSRRACTDDCPACRRACSRGCPRPETRRISEPSGVRKADEVSLGCCQPNRVQAKWNSMTLRPSTSSTRSIASVTPQFIEQLRSIGPRVREPAIKPFLEID